MHQSQSFILNKLKNIWLTLLKLEIQGYLKMEVKHNVFFTFYPIGKCMNLEFHLHGFIGVFTPPAPGGGGASVYIFLLCWIQWQRILTLRVISPLMHQTRVTLFFSSGLRSWFLRTRHVCRQVKHLVVSQVSKGRCKRLIDIFNSFEIGTMDPTN